MAKRLSVNELTTAMGIIVKNNITLATLDKETQLESFLAGLDEATREQVMVNEQVVGNSAELNFIAGAFIMKVAYEIKEKDKKKTLFLIFPTIRQLQDHRYVIYTVYLSLNDEEMEKVTAPYKYTEAENIERDEKLQQLVAG